VGSGKLAMLADHVRAWEGEEIEWKFIKVHSKQFTKDEEDRSSDIVDW